MIRGKKGAENVIASLILFIAVMGLATTTTIIFKNNMDSSANAVAEQQQRSTDVLKTAFVIALATYDDVNTTYVYVKNTGSTRFYPIDIDVYLDGVRVPRSDANRTINVTADTDSVNVGIWDPDEELEIQVFETFAASETHEIVVAASNGVKVKEEFSS